MSECKGRLRFLILDFEHQQLLSSDLALILEGQQQRYKGINNCSLQCESQESNKAATQSLP